MLKRIVEQCKDCCLPDFSEGYCTAFQDPAYQWRDGECWGRCDTAEEMILYYLIDERYRFHKSVIVTSNATLDELERRLEPRTLDRLCEMCDIVENKAPSRRMERAQARRGGR
jgi:hypothetical protein